MQNDTDDIAQFCTKGNVEDCIQYISLEFNALGYPSIYNPRCSNIISIDCNMVELLNGVFQLIGSHREQHQSREDLEHRNQALLSDLNVVRKKNAQLTENLEKHERKYRSALEKERQLKVENEKQQQIIKSEKDECRKLTSQMQQQKTTFQHQIRRLEGEVSQMKAKFAESLTDKKTKKKSSNVSWSHQVLKDSKQPKCQNGPEIDSSVDVVYSSVLSSYESKNQELMKEINDLRSILELIYTETRGILHIFEDLDNKSESDLSDSSTVWIFSSQIREILSKKFKILLKRLKEKALYKMKQLHRVQDEICSLKSMQIQPSFNASRDGCNEEESAEKGMNERREKCTNSLSLSQKIEVESQNLSLEHQQLSATLSENNVRNQSFDAAIIPQRISRTRWCRLQQLTAFPGIKTEDDENMAPNILNMMPSSVESSNQYKNAQSAKFIQSSERHDISEMDHISSFRNQISSCSSKKSTDSHNISSSETHHILPKTSPMPNSQAFLSSDTSSSLPKWAMGTTHLTILEEEDSSSD